MNISKSTHRIILIISACLLFVGCGSPETSPSPLAETPKPTDTSAPTDVPKPTSTPTSTDAPTNEPSLELPGRIAFVSNRDGNEEIYVVNPDGSNLTRLTNHPGDDYFPLWSHDASKIAFLSNRDGLNALYIVDANGGEPIPLTSNLNINFFAWSPMDQRIAIAAKETDFIHIYIISTGDGEVLQISKAETDHGFPAWSPDGKKVAYVTLDEGGFEVCTANSDGSEMTKLTAEPDLIKLFPTWSQDGKQILYMEYTKDFDSSSVYKINADGTHMYKLTKEDESGALDIGAWGPSDQIAISLSKGGFSDIYLIDPDGNELKQLTDHPATDSVAVWSPDGKRILFASDRDENAELYVIGIEDADLTRLTNHPAQDKQPAWSPPIGPIEASEADEETAAPLSPLPADGLIAFASDRDGDYEIFSIHADGSDQKQLTDNDRHDVRPVWSPDAEKIAFTQFRTGDSENYYEASNIYVMGRDGQNQNPLTFSPGTIPSFTNMEPKWSPDGKRIAFMSTQYGLPDLFVMNADGTNMLRLTELPSQVDMPSEGFQSGQNWSPDGERIVLISTRGEDNRDIYTMEDDGSELLQLTNHVASDNNPTWSPGGERIAFTSDRDNPDQPCYSGCNSEIYLINPDGSGLLRLTDDPGQDLSPVWSPDGKRIAFFSDRDGNWEIYVVDADGSNLTQITNNPADDWDPVWSPDGLRIAFVSNRDGNAEIYVVDADGLNLFRITHNPASDQYPAWTPPE